MWGKYVEEPGIFVEEIWSLEARVTRDRQTYLKTNIQLNM